MKHLLFLLTTIFFFSQSFGQRNDSDNQIGLSIPIIWNTTEIYNIYSGARADYISGSAVSYGININYLQKIFKSIYVTGGIGYYNQRFGIKRPFDFNGDTITNLGYYTEHYAYSSINWFVGIGYRHWLNATYSLSGSIALNSYHTFSQKYTPNAFSGYEYKKYQVEKRNYSLGKSLNLNAGVNRKISQKLLAGVELVIPVYTNWKKDRIFRENENEFYNSNFSMGTNICIKYNL